MATFDTGEPVRMIWNPAYTPPFVVTPNRRRAAPEAAAGLATKV
jgi:hypothetical protein